MSALLTSQQRSFRPTGKVVVVPDHDVSRLSYYLRCTTLDCGIDIIVDDLVDFKNVHKLPKARQDAIFRLAANEFSVSKMVNTTIFLDESGELCENRLNMFIELKKVTNVLAVGSSALVGGKQVEISKIMVFKPAWLQKYYFEPLQRWKEREQASGSRHQLQLLTSLLANIFRKDVTETASNHCDHCKGLEGSCVCEHACPPRQSTKCSAPGHCEHCKGIESAACECQADCPRSQFAKCSIVHTSIICDACRTTGLRGSRFKCDVCPDYDLCEECYRGGKHELTHPFSKIGRVGSNPIHLRPRQEPKVRDGSALNAKASTSSSATPAQVPSKPHKAKPDETEKALITFIGEKMCVSQMKDYLNENGVSYVGIREKLELLKLVWETQIEAMGAKELDAFIDAHCISCTEGRSVSAKRKAAVAAFDVIHKRTAAQRTEAAFREGDVVQLCGLNKESMNGMLASVVRSEAVNGRVQVRLVDDENCRYNIRPENLQAVPQDLD